MASTIFYSWQADRSKTDCRNFIQRCVEDAIQRLNSDMDVEESERDGLEIDSDTKNVPGSPPIFETILKKITTAQIFVADLTFVGTRGDGRLMSNPNVLIEYGYALNSPGELRIIAVMNTAYGDPTATDIPFNLSGRRFPIRYGLPEDASTEIRKAVKKELTGDLVAAIRTILDSPEYRAEQKARKPRAIEVSRAHLEARELEREIEELRSYHEGNRVRDLAKQLLETFGATVAEIHSQHPYEVQGGTAIDVQAGAIWAAVRVMNEFGIHISWQQARHPGQGEPLLKVDTYRGHLFLPGEQLSGYVPQPQLQTQEVFKPTLSRARELGWVKAKRGSEDPEYLTTEDLADACAHKVVALLTKYRNS